MRGSGAARGGNLSALDLRRDEARRHQAGWAAGHKDAAANSQAWLNALPPCLQVPRGPGSPPVPVMHSPPRPLTVKDQQDWKIPPCISNWKNSKVGFRRRRAGIPAAGPASEMYLPSSAGTILTCPACLQACSGPCLCCRTSGPPVPLRPAARAQPATPAHRRVHPPPPLQGYTIPLDKRLAADGRGLQEVAINDQFAKFTEALYIAEQKARSAVEARAKMQRELLAREKERKERELRELALKARMDRLGGGGVAGAFSNFGRERKSDGT